MREIVGDKKPITRLSVDKVLRIHLRNCLDRKI